MSSAPGRAALLEAGLALFAERGFEGASTRAIAERAGVPQGLIRHHFRSKEALFQEVVDQGLRGLAGCAPAEEAHATLLASAQRGAPLLAVLVHALLEPGPRRAWLVEQRLRPLLQRSGPALAAVLGRAPPPAEHDVLALLGALVAPLLFAPLAAAQSPRDPTPKAVVARLLQQSLGVLRAPRAAGAWAPLGRSAVRAR